VNEGCEDEQRMSNEHNHGNECGSKDKNRYYVIKRTIVKDGDSGDKVGLR
jgi:hypothetical protein